MVQTVSLTVNGVRREVVGDAEMPLLYVLRNDLGLTSPKYGCGLEQCGSCTVQIDGAPAFSCAVTLRQAAGKRIVTLEGIGSRAAPHPLQSAFIEEQALQCGYCTSGIVMAAKALLERNPDPTDDDIRLALRDNLCRCGSHPRVLKAVRRAAVDMKRQATR